MQLWNIVTHQSVLFQFLTMYVLCPHQTMEEEERWTPHLLCWGCGEFGQHCHGEQNDVSFDRSPVFTFKGDNPKCRVKYVGCGASHNVIITGKLEYQSVKATIMLCATSAIFVYSWNIIAFRQCCREIITRRFPNWNEEVCTELNCEIIKWTHKFNG